MFTLRFWFVLFGKSKFTFWWVYCEKVKQQQTRYINIVCICLTFHYTNCEALNSNYPDIYFLWVASPALRASSKGGPGACPWCLCMKATLWQKTLNTHSHTYGQYKVFSLPHVDVFFFLLPEDVNEATVNPCGIMENKEAARNGLPASWC